MSPRTAERSSSPSVPWLLERLDGGDRVTSRHPLTVGEHRLGSHDASDVRVETPGVSRHHAVVEVLPDGGLVIADGGSKNGTFVDGVRVERRAVTAPVVLGLGTAGAAGAGGARYRLRPADGSAAAGLAVVLPGAFPGDGSPEGDDPPSTQSLRLVDRLLALLAEAVEESCGEPAGLLAVRLAALWHRRLPVDGVEITRPTASGTSAVVAAAGVVDGARCRCEGVSDAGWTVRLAGPSPLPAGVASALAVTAELLAGRVLGAGRRQPEPTTSPVADEPLWASPAMGRLLATARQAAAGDLPVLLLGESGVGKEVVAGFVHRASPRAERPLVAVNCAALPPELLEAELFGIEKGVATGVDARPGLLERADGGTLFLDEVGDMPAPLQAKVLRVLEGAPFCRVGGSRALQVDVRVVAATNLDLGSQVTEGAFRADLYHRLAAFVLRLPPLRERPEDVVVLAGAFFQRQLARRGVASPGITRGALAALLAHRWPGNVRELSHEIARAVLLLDSGAPLDLPQLSEHLQPASDGDGDDGGDALTLACAVARAERRAFRTALAASGGDARGARELLGVSRTTWYRKLSELGISPGGDGLSDLHARQIGMDGSARRSV